MGQPQFERLGWHLIEGSNDCVKLLDLDGRVVYVNPAGVELLDLCGSEDLVDRPWLSVWEGDHQTAARNAVARAKACTSVRSRSPTPAAACWRTPATRTGWRSPAPR